MGTDRIHHGFWRFLDPEHRLYEPGTRTSAVLDYYKAVDEKIERLLRFADEDTAVLVVSDHGAKRMDGGICVNEWLRRGGLPRLERRARRADIAQAGDGRLGSNDRLGEGGYLPTVPQRSRSRATGCGGAENYERVRGELKQELEALGDDEGRPIGTVAHLPEELYPQRNGIAPDLLVYFGDLLWRSVGQVGTGTVHVFENDTGPDDANHAHEGLYVLAAEDGPHGPERARPSDVAPTILQLLGEPVPADMEGVSMLASAHI